MKYRKDFVTNSSSSSFVIAKKYLDEDQLKAIRKHDELGEMLGIPYSSTDKWRIDENDLLITGYTDMDNFDFAEFFQAIEVDSNHIHWSDVPFYSSLFQEELPEESVSEEPEEPEYDWRELIKDL